MTRSSRKGKGSGGERGKELSRLDTKHQKCRLGHKMGQIWIPEIEYSQKVSSHAQIGPLGAEKQQRT